MSGVVCGREYEVVEAGTDRSKKTSPRPRILVEGVMHPGGGGKLPIRFKSVKAAENHLLNKRGENHLEALNSRV